MRSIDADELLASMGISDAVKYGNKTPEQQHMSYSSFMAYEIADEINAAPTLGPVIVWTPVEKEIPDKPATWYLVSFSWGTTGFLMHGDIRRGAQDGTVTAWAEKPAPYKAVTP